MPYAYYRIDNEEGYILLPTITDSEKKCAVFEIDKPYTNANLAKLPVNVSATAASVQEMAENKLPAIATKDIPAQVMLLYEAAHNSIVLGRKEWKHMSLFALKRALMFMVVDAEKVIDTTSANKLWSYRSNTADITVHTCIKKTNWHNALRMGNDPTHAELDLQSYNACDSGFFNQYHFMSRLPDMPKKNALASYPGTICHCALGYYAIKPALFNPGTSTFMKSILDINDPMLKAIGEAVLKATLRSPVADKADARWLVPYVSWGKGVPVVYPDLETTNTVIEFKTQWANLTVNAEYKAVNGNQVLMQAAIKHLTEHSTITATLLSVCIPNRQFVKKAQLRIDKIDVNAEQADCIYRQLLSRFIRFKKGLDAWYCDEYCTFPLRGLFGAVLLAYSGYIYVHVANVCYKYCPAFWKCDGNRCSIVNDEPQPPDAIVIDVYDSGTADFNEDIRASNMSDPLFRCFQAYAHVNTFVWFDRSELVAMDTDDDVAETGPYPKGAQVIALFNGTWLNGTIANTYEDSVDVGWPNKTTVTKYPNKDTSTEIRVLNSTFAVGDTIEARTNITRTHFSKCTIVYVKFDQDNVDKDDIVLVVKWKTKGYENQTYTRMDITTLTRLVRHPNIWNTEYPSDLDVYDDGDNSSVELADEDSGEESASDDAIMQETDAEDDNEVEDKDNEEDVELSQSEDGNEEQDDGDNSSSDADFSPESSSASSTEDEDEESASEYESAAEVDEDETNIKNTIAKYPVNSQVKCRYDGKWWDGKITKNTGLLIEVTYAGPEGAYSIYEDNAWVTDIRVLKDVYIVDDTIQVQENAKANFTPWKIKKVNVNQDRLRDDDVVLVVRMVGFELKIKREDLTDMTKPPKYPNLWDLENPAVFTP